jgi:hypothetical protein
MKLSYPILAGLFALAAAACERGAKDKAPAETATAGETKAGGAGEGAGKGEVDGAKPKEGFGRLSIDEVAARIGKKGVYLIDNNPRDVWEKGHLPTATWVDYTAMTAADLPADKSATLIFYCANEH